MSISRVNKERAKVTSFAIVGLLAAVLVTSCASTPAANPTPQATVESAATSSPQATETALPATQAATATEAATEPATATSEATATPSPQMTATGATTEPVALDGPAISYNGVQLTLTNGVAVSVTARIVPTAEVPADSQPFLGYPQYTEFVLNGYATNKVTREPRIMIFPVQGYTETGEPATQMITRLQQLLAERPALPPALFAGPTQTLPFLPVQNAAQVFSVKADYLEFQNGAGVRYVTHYAQAPNPVTNQELIYTFQGLTSDGKYYVSVIVPISSAVLPDMDTLGTPSPTVIPLPTLDPNDAEAYARAFNEYISEVMNRLENEREFMPRFNDLDALVQSISVESSQ